MSRIISTTVPNNEGEMLWYIHFAGSYYDNDDRMPGNVPIDNHFFVLAKSKDEAVTKVRKEINKAKKRCDKSSRKEITASIVSIEDFIPARDCSNDGRMGWISTNKLSMVELSCKEDRARYRLAVCLVPVE